MLVVLRSIEEAQLRGVMKETERELELDTSAASGFQLPRRLMTGLAAEKALPQREMDEALPPLGSTKQLKVGPVYLLVERKSQGQG